MGVVAAAAAAVVLMLSPLAGGSADATRPLTLKGGYSALVKGLNWRCYALGRVRDGDFTVSCVGFNGPEFHLFQTHDVAVRTSRWVKPTRARGGAYVYSFAPNPSAQRGPARIPPVTGAVLQPGQALRFSGLPAVRCRSWPSIARFRCDARHVSLTVGNGRVLRVVSPRPARVERGPGYRLYWFTPPRPSVPSVAG